MPKWEQETTNNKVKVYKPVGNRNYWRITWRDQTGKLKDTTAKDFATAMEKAAEIDQRLSLGGADKSTNTGAQMIAAYLDPIERLRVGNAWGASHSADQEWLLNTHLLPIIKKTICSRITNAQLRKVIQDAKTPSMAKHLSVAITGLINWGVEDGWIIQSGNTLIAGFKTDVKNKEKSVRTIKQQGGDREQINPNEIPNHESVSRVAKCSVITFGVWWAELMFNLDAYSGLRLGEIIDLDVDDIDLIKRQINVDFQVLDVKGKKSRALPKGNKQRKTIFPRVTPMGYQLQEQLERRIKEVKEAGKERDGRLLLFPAQRGGWMNHGTFSAKRRAAQKLAGWKMDQDGKYQWGFHSLRHTFCTYYLFDCGKDARDVSVAAGHESVATTLRMYSGPSAGALERLTSED